MCRVSHWCCIRVSIRIVLSLSQNYIIRCFNRSICSFPYPFNINNATNVICVSMIMSIHIPIVIIVVNMSISSSINRSSCSCLDIFNILILTCPHIYIYMGTCHFILCRASSWVLFPFAQWFDCRYLCVHRLQ